MSQIAIKRIVPKSERLCNNNVNIITNGTNSDKTKSYKVQHIRTFEIKPKNVLPNTKMAMKELMKDCYEHVKSYEMVLQNIDGENYLLLKDPHTGHREVERFRINVLLYPRSRTTTADDFPVNNILTFTIRAASLSNNRPVHNEIHMYQVLGVKAKEVALELLNRGAVDTDTYDDIFETPKLPERALSEPELLIPLKATPKQLSKPRHSSVTKLYKSNRVWIEREVDLLNQCFDVIEEKVKKIKDKSPNIQTGHSNSVAASSRTQSIASVTNKYNRSMSEAADNLRRVQSSSEEFFRKWKFAVILLARLNDYVEYPSSSELFVPLLALLKYAVDATRSPITRRPDLARSIQHPRFTHHCLIFIQSNLPLEYERMWRCLGSAWNVPREEYTNEKYVFIPTFKNQLPLNPNDYEPTLFRYNDPNIEQEITCLDGNLSPELKSEINLKKRNSKFVYQSFFAQSEDELTVQKGDFVELLEDHGKRCKIRNELGEEGYCPRSAMRLP